MFAAKGESGVMVNNAAKNVNHFYTSANGLGDGHSL
jgi:hypothetical protein